MCLRRIAVMLALLMVAVPTRAADWSKIDRTLQHPPACKSATPQYCLLVFGPEARTQVWVVLDDRIAHIYASPNGIAPRVWRQVPMEYNFFLLGDVWEADGKTRHTQLCFRPTWDQDKFTVRINGEYEQHAGQDRTGILQFAARAEDAPIVHFNGPLTLDLYLTQEPLRSDREVRLSVAVGTPGRGMGSFASFNCNYYLHRTSPIAQVDYPPAQPDGPPVSVEYRLSKD